MEGSHSRDSSCALAPLRLEKSNPNYVVDDPGGTCGLQALQSLSDQPELSQEPGRERKGPVKDPRLAFPKTLPHHLNKPNGNTFQKIA